MLKGVFTFSADSSATAARELLSALLESRAVRYRSAAGKDGPHAPSVIGLNESDHSLARYCRFEPHLGYTAMITMLLSVAVFALIKWLFVGLFEGIRNKRADNLLRQAEEAMSADLGHTSSQELGFTDRAA